MSSQNFQMLFLHLQFLFLPPVPMWPLPSIQPPSLESMGEKSRNKSLEIIPELTRCGCRRFNFYKIKPIHP
jgi:hypothetical protein